MKTYKVVVNTGDYGKVEAENEEELLKKLSTGSYGVLPIRSRTMIRFIPENIKEIIEESE